MTRARQRPQSAERKLLNFRGKNTNSRKCRSYCLRAADREVGCNLSILLRVDTEFFHSRKESRAVHSQARGSTVGAAHAPLARSQGPYDLIALLSFIFVSSATFVIWRICSFSSDWFNFVQFSTHECFRNGFRSSSS